MRARGEIAGDRKAIKVSKKSTALSSPKVTSLAPAGGKEMGSFSWAIKAGEAQRPRRREARLRGLALHAHTAEHLDSVWLRMPRLEVPAACSGPKVSRHKEGFPGPAPPAPAPSQGPARPHLHSVSCSTCLSDFRPVLVLYNRERGTV